MWLSAGDGTWVIPRIGAGGIPNEYTGKRWYTCLPPSLLGKGMIAISRNAINPNDYNLGDGGNPATDGVLAVCDDLAYRIINAKIKVVPRLAGFTPTGVIFVDGSSLDVDIVVFATGFLPDYGFVDCPGIQSTWVWKGYHENRVR